ncbi:hypothetical protein F153LOC_15345 [Lelliottia sp. F153]|nr:hypothetical protein DAI21_19275 [Lelliottia sp. WB101]PLY44575.1 hypothetical protein F159LOC_14860 [Lelliottia sp. F159]PLY49684.1 hypothetical protein F154LOC_15700 [Lelliottia sp. F154]PLY54033.1 hypothetical protein F153LOC_15345 [Lelliottia sp. F153]UQC73241.1 hypothetical protein C0560_07435 [Lelliottia sp. AC1]
MQFIQNVTIDTVEIFARALLAIYHYYCLSVFLPYSCLDPVHITVQSLYPLLITSPFIVCTRCRFGFYGEKTVARRLSPTSRMASVHTMRRFH